MAWGSEINQVFVNDHKDIRERGFDSASGDSDDTVPGRFEHSLPLLVVLTLRVMNSAVNLNDQSMFRAEEVHDEWPDCLLPTEFRSVLLPIPQRLP